MMELKKYLKHVENGDAILKKAAELEALLVATAKSHVGGKHLKDRLQRVFKSNHRLLRRKKDAPPEIVPIGLSSPIPEAKGPEEIYWGEIEDNIKEADKE